MHSKRVHLPLQTFLIELQRIKNILTDPVNLANVDSIIIDHLIADIEARFAKKKYSKSDRKVFKATLNIINRLYRENFP